MGYDWLAGVVPIFNYLRISKRILNILVNNLLFRFTNKYLQYETKHNYGMICTRTITGTITETIKYKFDYN